MPGYQYRGTVFDAAPPPPKPPKPKAKRGRRPRNLPSPCGTPSAYTRHRMKGEPMDEACRLANAAACKARREKNKTP